MYIYIIKSNIISFIESKKSVATYLKRESTRFSFIAHGDNYLNSEIDSELLLLLKQW